MKKREQDTKRDVVVYQHRRVNDSEIFYIGIGRKNRPYSNTGRNDHWTNYTNKYDYIVDILFENLTWEEACIKEKSLILYHGRRDLKEGTLVNMTDGGDGQYGRKDSEDRIEEKRTKMLQENPMYRKELRQKVANSKLGKPRPDMTGTNNPNFKTGVRDKKEKAWQAWIESEKGKKYKKSLKIRYENTLGSEESKQKAKVGRELRLISLDEQQKSAMTQKMNDNSYECVHCKIRTNRGNLSRWHNEKCKLK